MSEGEKRNVKKFGSGYDAMPAWIALLLRVGGFLVAVFALLKYQYVATGASQRAPVARLMTPAPMMGTGARSVLVLGG